MSFTPCPATWNSTLSLQPAMQQAILLIGSAHTWQYDKARSRIFSVLCAADAFYTHGKFQ
jgi:hypothetical protein